jgi:hypothetical protein
MQTLNLVQKKSAPLVLIPCIAAAIASLGLAPQPANAQNSPCVSTRPISTTNCVDGVIYYDRPVSSTSNSGTVSTSSGIGLNVRQGPGLNYPIIGGADDGVFLNLAGQPVFADGYRWQQVSSGGWVATEYVSGGTTNVGFDPDYCYRPTGVDNCYTPISTLPGNIGNGNGPSPIRPPIAVVPPAGINQGRYVVAVPGSGVVKVAQVRRFVPSAYPDRAMQGSFVNAGAFNDYNLALSMTNYLRANNLDARVIYR